MPDTRATSAAINWPTRPWIDISPTERSFGFPSGFGRLLFVLVIANVAFCGIDSASADLFADEWKVDVALRPDRRLPALLSVLEDSRASATNELKNRWKLGVGDLVIEWHLTRKLEASERGAHLGRTEVSRERVVVRIPAHRFLARPEKARQVVVHEAAHALLASSIGSRRYRALPVWLREGFALLVSGEGESRLFARASLEIQAGRKPAECLRGIDASDVFPVEGYLAIRRMDRLLGRDGLAAMFGKFSVSTWSAERRRAFGLNQTEFRRASISSATERLNNLLTSERREAFAKAIRDLEARRYQEALNSWASIQRMDPDGVLSLTSRYYWGRALIGARKYAKAREVLSPLVEGKTERLWEAESLISLAEAERALGREERARRLISECLERFPDDESALRRARALRDAAD